MTRLDAYRRLHGLSLSQLGKLLGRTQPQAGRYCKSRSEPGHNVPQWQVGQKIEALTHGVIHLGNYADEIGPAEAAEMMAEIARRAAAGGEAARG